jgi:hypothetical protein
MRTLASIAMAISVGLRRPLVFHLSAIAVITVVALDTARYLVARASGAHTGVSIQDYPSLASAVTRSLARALFTADNQQESKDKYWPVVYNLLYNL